LESQNAELEAQQSELEGALDVVAREKARLERFHAFAQAIAGHTDLERLGETVLEFLCADAEADVGVLYVRNPAVAVYERFATRGVPADRVVRDVRESDGIAGRAIAERRIIAVNVRDAGLPVAVMGGVQPARHQVSVPLLAGVQATGVVTLGRVEDRPFGADELATIRRLADQAAVAVARSRMQRQTERSLRTIQDLLDATPDPIALVARDGAITFENRPMAELRAAERDEELARSAFDAPGTETYRRAQDELTLDGGRVLLRYAAPLTDEDDAAVGRIVVLRDVTAEREADRLKDEFFALVSHELRTPLTSIVGYLEMALEEDHGQPGLDPQRRRFLGVIERNASRLQRLVGDLLFVAQVEAGTLTLQRGEADLAVLAREAVEAARPRAADAGVELSLRAPDALPLAGADGDRLGQMLDNLIVNALKFTPPGGSVAVTVGGERDVELSVADTGVGIDPADQERLFERFYRAEGATERSVAGVGLGLTIVRAIVQGHGGEITLQSTPGEGTTFDVRLPRRRRGDVALSERAAPAPAVAAPGD
ncbi:MAG: ATP-binding protein, partial [Solirubrobacteraceae bacterium]